MCTFNTSTAPASTQPVLMGVSCLHDIIVSQERQKRITVLLGAPYFYQTHLNNFRTKAKDSLNTVQKPISLKIDM